jgi:hypothetical protein
MRWADRSTGAISYAGVSSGVHQSKANLPLPPPDFGFKFVLT